ncbi:hypothetical protein [Thermosphaera sp.]
MELAKWQVLAVTGGIFTLVFCLWAVVLSFRAQRAPHAAPRESVFRLVLDVGDNLKKKPQLPEPLALRGLEERDHERSEY